MGGYFLEYNNFLPGDPLKTPLHIAPTWYFTPFYSVLRAVTADFIWVLMVAVAAYVSFLWLKSRLAFRTKAVIAVVALVIIIGMLPQVLDAKFWGVVFFGASVVILAFLPWLDHSPVKSIRYRPNWHKYLYALLAITFVALGYLGTQPPSVVKTIVSQVGTLYYFAFFLLMPWWSTMGTFKKVPDRVVFHAH
jgi:ubiquinol-cytochrome c reductase cytochrome b subunit